MEADGTYSATLCKVATRQRPARARENLRNSLSDIRRTMHFLLLLKIRTLSSRWAAFMSPCEGKESRVSGPKTLARSGIH